MSSDSVRSAQAIAALVAEAAAIVGSLREEGGRDRPVRSGAARLWRAYAQLEYATAILKLELGIERPTEFMTTTPPGEWRMALSQLSDGLGVLRTRLDAHPGVQEWEQLRALKHQCRTLLARLRHGYDGAVSSPAGTRRMRSS